MQMAVCNVDFCDFILWSPKGMFVQRIERDVEFWNELQFKLTNFHHNVLVPEYFEMRMPRRLLTDDLSK